MMRAAPRNTGCVRLISLLDLKSCAAASNWMRPRPKCSSGLISRIIELPRALLRGLFCIAVDREDGLESGDLEDLEDMGLERRKDDPAIEGLEPFGGDHQHHKARTGDVLQFFSVDDQASFPAINQLMQPLREGLCWSGVQPPYNADDTNTSRFPLSDLHDSPPLCRAGRCRSAACS